MEILLGAAQFFFCISGAVAFCVYIIKNVTKDE